MIWEALNKKGNQKKKIRRKKSWILLKRLRLNNKQKNEIPSSY